MQWLRVVVRPHDRSGHRCRGSKARWSTQRRQVLRNALVAGVKILGRGGSQRITPMLPLEPAHTCCVVNHVHAAATLRPYWHRVPGSGACLACRRQQQQETFPRDRRSSAQTRCVDEYAGEHTCEAARHRGFLLGRETGISPRTAQTAPPGLLEESPSRRAPVQTLVDLSSEGTLALHRGWMRGGGEEPTCSFLLFAQARVSRSCSRSIRRRGCLP